MTASATVRVLLGEPVGSDAPGRGRWWDPLRDRHGAGGPEAHLKADGRLPSFGAWGLVGVGSLTRPASHRSPVRPPDRRVRPRICQETRDLCPACGRRDDVVVGVDIPQGRARRGCAQRLGGRLNEKVIPAAIAGFADLPVFCSDHVGRKPCHRAVSRRELA